jgi:ribosomal protein S17E
MNILLNKKEQESMIWMLDNFIKLHEPDYENNKTDIENAKSILTKIIKNKK